LQFGFADELSVPKELSLRLYVYIHLNRFLSWEAGLAWLLPIGAFPFPHFILQKICKGITFKKENITIPRRSGIAKYISVLKAMDIWPDKYNFMIPKQMQQTITFVYYDQYKKVYKSISKPVELKHKRKNSNP
jgi:hypothetical protein